MADAARTKLFLSKVSVFPKWGEQTAKDVAERTDKGITQLKDQMQNFEAAEVTTVGGVPASG